jgi:hypothetical protein
MVCDLACAVVGYAGGDFGWVVLGRGGWIRTNAVACRRIPLPVISNIDVQAQLRSQFDPKAPWLF